MEEGKEKTKFVSSRVAERINEYPVLAMLVLEELRATPQSKKDQKPAYGEKYGMEFMQLHEFLGRVITDRELYEEINISQEVIEAASQYPVPTEKITILTSREEAIEKTIVQAQRNRANELLAMVRISVDKIIEEQSNFELEQVN